MPGRWTLTECGNCEVIALRPTPSNLDLNAYYANYSSGGPSNYPTSAGARHPSLRKLFHCISGDVDPRDFVVAPENARILDYGCGYGVYLADFLNRGWRASGVEISANVVSSCQERGLDVRRAPNDGHIPFDSQEFDTVYLMQVFEHLPNPTAFMGELNRILKVGGALYMAVPNSRSIWRTAFGENWVSGWFTPFHLYHYSATSIASLAKRYGFRIDWIKYRTPESWFRLNLKALLYSGERELENKASWLDLRPIRYMLMCILRVIEIPVRQRDCMLVRTVKVAHGKSDN